MSLPNKVLEIIFEHSELAALFSLRRVCRRFKQVADISFTIMSHLPMPEEDYQADEIEPDGNLSARVFTRRELTTSTIRYGEREISMTLEEGWSVDLTSLEAAIKRTLARASPGGQVSWATHDEGKALALMREIAPRVHSLSSPAVLDLVQSYSESMVSITDLAVSAWDRKQDGVLSTQAIKHPARKTKHAEARTP